MNMRILSITSLFPNKKQPNKGIFVLNRLQALSKYADIEIIVPIPWFPFIKTNRPRNIPFKEKINTLTIYHPKFFSIPKFFKFLDGYFFYLSLKKFKRKIKNADIIDAHFAWPDGYGSLLISEKYQKRFSITLRGKDINYWLKKSLTKDKIKKILRKSDLIISVSENLKKAKIKNIKVVPNGIDTIRFKPFNKKEARRKLNLSKNQKIFLTIGNDFKRKGYFKLIKAFDNLDIKGKLLLVIGYDKSEFKSLKKKISSLKSRDKIRLLGEISNKELPLYYSLADIYCLVSHSEGWPNSVMEALACGKPCVVTKEAAGEFITRDLGIITDYNSLTDNLKKALDKKWNTSKILKFAKNNSWDKTARKIYEEFQKII